jgi:aminoglycoside 3-N-acetyltransferase I
VDYSIKKLSLTDVKLAKELIRLWQAEDGMQHSATPNVDYLADLLSRDSFHVYVALMDNVVVGGLSGYELPMFPEEVTEMFLYEIGVDEGHRKNGIASMLIDALKETCKIKGIKIIFVGTSTDNKPAIKLYKSTGGVMEEIPWFTYQL